MKKNDTFLELDGRFYIMDLFGIIVDISKVSKIYNLTQNIIAYSNFLFAKESAGIQRAVGIVLISQVEEDQSMKEYFASLITIQKIYLENFLKYTSLDGKKIFKKYFKGNSIMSPFVKTNIRFLFIPPLMLPQVTHF